MEITLGKKIAMLRKQKELKQEDVAERLGVSPQAVSKWENDQTCPDITLLPELAQLLGVSVDELLTGKQSSTPAVKILGEADRKEIKDMTLKIIVTASGGSKVRVNIPMPLVEVAIETGMAMPQISENEALKGIDLKEILNLVRQGVVGNLVEVESAEGSTVQIFVE